VVNALLKHVLTNSDDESLTKRVSGNDAFNRIATAALPVRILIADGDCRKLQTVFEIHADVDVLRMRCQVGDFSNHEIRENTTRPEDDQCPKNSNKKQHV